MTNDERTAYAELIANPRSAEFSAMKLLWKGPLVSRILEGHDTYPAMMELSLTMACDLRCVWCVDRPWRYAKPGTWDKDLLLERLAEFWKLGTSAITVEGGGEPLLHRDFDQIVTHAAAMGFHLGLITNGGHLPEHDKVLPLFQWIRVSLDAYDEETYGVLKGGDGDGFARAMRGIEAAVDAKVPVVGVGYLNSDAASDPRKLGELVRKLKNIGADYFQVRRITNPEQIQSAAGRDRGYDPMRQLRAHETPRFKVYVHQMAESVVGNAGLPCLAHRLSVTIGGGGDVYLCCRLRTAKNDYLGWLGNLKDSTVEELWKGERRAELVEMMKDWRNTAKLCPECRLTKYNVMLHSLKETEATRRFL